MTAKDNAAKDNAAKSKTLIDHTAIGKSVNEGMSEKQTSLLMLFGVFFRIGLFTFGGGYAMLPMLQREVVDNHKWSTFEELMDYFAISQITPGIIAINTATFVGLKYKGMIGGAVATLGVVTPSWIIISIIATFLKVFENNVIIEKAFLGIRIVVVALILQAVVTMGKKVLKHSGDYFLMFGAFLLISSSLLSSIVVIMMGVFIGILRVLLKERQYGAS